VNGKSKVTFDGVIGNVTLRHRMPSYCPSRPFQKLLGKLLGLVYRRGVSKA